MIARFQALPSRLAQRLGRRRSNSSSAVSDSAEVIEEYDNEESQIQTMEEVLMRERDDGDLTLHDVFVHRNDRCSSSDTSQYSSCSQNKKTSNDRPIDIPIAQASTSRTPSRSSMTSGQSSSSSPYSSQDHINRNEWRLKTKRTTNSDDTSNLMKCIAGAFDKLDELVTKSNQFEEVPLELSDEDQAFGRSVALSLKHIKSQKRKFIVKSKIMTELAMAVNDEETN